MVYQCSSLKKIPGYSKIYGLENIQQIYEFYKRQDNHRYSHINIFSKYSHSLDPCKNKKYSEK